MRLLCWKTISSMTINYKQHTTIRRYRPPMIVFELNQPWTSNHWRYDNYIDGSATTSSITANREPTVHTLNVSLIKTALFKTRPRATIYFPPSQDTEHSLAFPDRYTTNTTLNKRAVREYMYPSGLYVRQMKIPTL